MIEAPTLLIPPRTAILRLQARWARACRDPYYFFKRFVWTNRVISREESVVERFPIERPHLRATLETWRDNQIIALDKIRQIMATWFGAGVSVWDPITKRKRLIMQQAKKFEDVVGDRETGDGLMGRANFIIDHIPYKRALGLDIEQPEGRIRFKHTKSTIWGIPQGGNIIRQRTAAGIVSDECAYQDEFSEAWASMVPCIRSGGWVLLMSTAALLDGGQWKRIVHDLPEPS